VITPLLAVLLTVVVAPALAVACRRTVTRSMSQAAGATSHTPAQPPPPPPAPGGMQLPRVAAGPAIRALRRHAPSSRHRLALVYGCAGAAQAAVMTPLALRRFEPVPTRALIWLSTWLVMALPVAPTVA